MGSSGGTSGKEPARQCRRSLGEEDPLEEAWKCIPVFLPGESHGWKNLVGYSPWGRKESDTTERFHFTYIFQVNSSSSNNVPSYSEILFFTNFNFFFYI